MGNDVIERGDTYFAYPPPESSRSRSTTSRTSGASSRSVSLPTATAVAVSSSDASTAAAGGARAVSGASLRTRTAVRAGRRPRGTVDQARGELHPRGQNPLAGAPAGAGLAPHRRADLLRDKQDRFGVKRFTCGSTRAAWRTRRRRSWPCTRAGPGSPPPSAGRPCPEPRHRTANSAAGRHLACAWQ